MSWDEISRVIDGTEELSLKEKKVIKKTYKTVREEIKPSTYEDEVNSLTCYIAYVRMNLKVA